LSIFFKVGPGAWYLKCNRCGRWATGAGRRQRSHLEQEARMRGWDVRRALCHECKKLPKTSVKAEFEPVRREEL